MFMADIQHGQSDVKTMVDFIWDVAKLLRGRFKPKDNQDVILPMTVLRRFDTIIQEKQDAVRAAYEKFRSTIDEPEVLLRNVAEAAFYNTSKFNFKRLLEDPANIDHNVQAYLNGYSSNVREIFEHFDFRNTLAKLRKQKLTFLIFEQFGNANIHPNNFSNHDMGYIFEELIRKFNEETNESPGEFYTPREIVSLMTELMLAGDEEKLDTSGLIRQVYDSCCGTGGMLTIAKERIEKINNHVTVELFGQEVNPKTFAVAKSDMLMLDPSGKMADNIQIGSTLSEDKFSGTKFHYMISNPPYGVDWKPDKTEVKKEAELGFAGRFGPGIPPINDGQTLFLLNSIKKMKPVSEGGSRIAIVMNGSPLFTGDANQAVSEIRRHVFENDLLEALVALPEDMFYNTGITTYIWVISNRKSEIRKGRVQLIDASSDDFWVQMRKSLGKKRRKMSEEHIQKVLDIYNAFEEDTSFSKIYPNENFSFRKVTVDRPLRLNFQTSSERLEQLHHQKQFAKLGDDDQTAYRKMLQSLPNKLYMCREEFLRDLMGETKSRNLKLPAPLKKAILNALGKRDVNAEVCKNNKGNLEADVTLRDFERIPFGVTIKDYMEKEVVPHVSDAWVNETKAGQDTETGTIGKIGYEINFNRFFYVYKPPRALEVIDEEVLQLKKEFNDLMNQLFD